MECDFLVLGSQGIFLLQMSISGTRLELQFLMQLTPCNSSVGGGFVVNEKTQGSSIQIYARKSAYQLQVDENLFYKGVDKANIEPSRLSQILPSNGTAAFEAPGKLAHTISAASSSDTPPYLFDSGSSLLDLTENHNVRCP